MRLAYLNNHTSAAAFFSRLCFGHGWEIYIPLSCPEAGALSGDAAARSRRLSLTPGIVDALDSVDFYGRSPPSSKVLKILEDCFDAVLIPNATPTRALLSVASRIRTPVVIYDWGEYEDSLRTSDFTSVLHRRNVKRAFQFMWHGSALKVDLPLGLNPRIFEVESCGPSDMPVAGSIVSRLRSSSFSRTILTTLAELCADESWHFRLFGKDNDDFVLPAKLASSWASFRIYPQLSIETLYGEMARLTCFIYWNTDGKMLQYSPLESVFLGTPVVYSKFSLLSQLMPDDDDGRISDFSQFASRMSSVLAAASRRDMVSRQSQVLAPFLRAEEKWSDFLNSIK
jgi:hypothetical protein